MSALLNSHKNWLIEYILINVYDYTIPGWSEVFENAFMIFSTKVFYSRGCYGLNLLKLILVWCDIFVALTSYLQQRRENVRKSKKKSNAVLWKNRYLRRQMMFFFLIQNFRIHRFQPAASRFIANGFFDFLFRSCEFYKYFAIAERREEYRWREKERRRRNREGEGVGGREKERSSRKREGEEEGEERRRRSRRKREGEE